VDLKQIKTPTMIVQPLSKYVVGPQDKFLVGKHYQGFKE
jgi:hypothetical protein